MSQMLVRIDKKMNDALIEIAKVINDPDAGEDEVLPNEAVCIILNGVMNQWIKNRSNEETAEIIGFKRAEKENAAKK